MRIRTAAVVVALLAVVSGTVLAADSAAPALKKGDRIVFLGDSITAGGARPDGYITLIKNAKDLFNAPFNVIGPAAGAAL